MAHIPGMIRAMAAVPRVHLADPQANAQEILALLRQADEQRAELCVFPELCLCGYTCADLLLHPPLLAGCLQALETLLRAPVRAAFVVGLPLEIGGRLYNCAAAVCGGRILGVVPKAHLPNSGEFYEKRWFEPGASAPESMTLCGQSVPVGGDLVFDGGRFSFGIELCEDLWVPAPPSARLCMGGALMIVNPSASNELVTKHRYRCELIAQQSARCLCGYLYAGAGYGESTTDLVFPAMPGSTKRPPARRKRALRPPKAPSPSRMWTWNACASSVARAAPSPRTRRNPCAPSALSCPRMPTSACCAPFLLPFVPAGAERDARTEEILLIQTTALLTRMERVNTQRAVLGVSGGLDSTLTLLAAAYAFRRAGYPMEGLVGITMPGMGTGSRTLQNALRLMALIGCTTRTIPIVKAVEQHFEDIGQDPELHDVAYENSQARERTQIIMDVANQIGGLALGTGDLSELALGWCTYNGDQMSMYNMSASVPKTLIRHLVRYAGAKLGGEIAPVVEDILDTPISPELIPSKAGELTQRTEDTLGAYALHDFFLYHMMDSGASPLKLYPLAKAAFDGQYADDAILAALRTFVRRFFTQQFKRSAMPDGPKVGSVSLSPRGDWRMPSDAQSILWMQEVEQLERQHP
ncbi:MAG: NAD(+) synthase [Christensenellales bacterium]